MILVNILESVERPALFFVDWEGVEMGDWRRAKWRNDLEQMMCFSCG